MENELVLKNIAFSYGKKTVLNDISFSCSNGTIALLGNNGVGKTTLMHIITNLKNGYKGEVLLNGINIKSEENINSKIGYLPQTFDIYNNVTGYDLLSYVCDIKNVEDKKQHIDELVRMFNLESVIKKSIGKYSGGYKRRLGIAQAMVGNPSLVIVDEPTVGLDPEQRLEFRQYLSYIAQDRIILISTHIIEDIELYSKKVVILKNGSVLLDGDINSVIQAASNKIRGAKVNIQQLNILRKNVKIIEEKRIDNNILKIKYIDDGDYIIENSYQEQEVTLENAYVLFQQR